MRTPIRWTVRLVAVVAAVAVAWPAVATLRRAEQPMPLPESVWSLSPSLVTPRPLPAARRSTQTSMAPLRVAVPELDISLPYTEAGISDGWLQLPEGIDSAVHLSNGSTLAHGAFLVAAHVNGRDLRPSPFIRLWQVRPGTIVLASDGVGTVHRFKVTSLQNHSKAQLPDEIFEHSGDSRLVLVTCGGPLQTLPDGSRHYRDNVVVTAAAMGPGMDG